MARTKQLPRLKAPRPAKPKEAPGVPKSIDSEDFNTKAFEALQSASQRTVLDIVDKLRRSGLNGTIELPQLVVVGDQSSGKSSVLEAITQIQFPRGEGLCTRFATTILLRRDSRRSSITIRIIPDRLASDKESQKLKDFAPRISDFGQLPAIIEEVEELMALGKPGEPGSKTFSKNVLSIEISGPDRPALTLVDLPGLIHVARNSPEDKAIVFEMAQEYASNPRSIILAVVSGRNDWNNQIILEMVHKIDEGGKRTLGIVTKPDTISERDIPNWIDLVQNKLAIYLERGWHVLRNRSPEEGHFTFEQRNQAEKAFFSTGKFSQLASDSVGIDALRERLSEILFQHLVKELPAVREEIQVKLHQTHQELDDMGEKRTTITEQRSVLMKTAMTCHTILRSAVTGYYADAFFGNLNMDAAPDSDENITRFRAAVQHLNLDFAGTMRRQGARFIIKSTKNDHDADILDEYPKDEDNAIENASLGTSLPKPKTLDRKDAIAWVQTLLVRSRGSELVGNFNPTLIGSIFKEMSGGWEKIGIAHIQRVFRICKSFVYKVIRHSSPQDFADRLSSRVDKALDGALKEAKAELSKIIMDKEGQPITYCASFTAAIQRARQRKHARISRDVTLSSTVTYPYGSNGRMEIDPIKLEQALAGSIEQDMDKFSAEEALDTARAYYKDALQYFISTITIQVIERHLVKVLPDIVLSPLVVSQMNDQEVTFVAAEARETTQRRATLEEKQAILEKGLETFREAMLALKR